VSAGRIPLAKAIESKRLLGAAFSPYPRQLEILVYLETCIRAVLCLGRRSGKTKGICAPFLVWRATCCPHLNAYVQAGEEIWHVAVCPKESQAKLMLQECKRLIDASPVLRAMVVRSTETGIYFDNGHVILVLVASGRTARGPAIATLVIDEMAFMINDTDGPQTARLVYRALTPALAQFADDRRLVLASTPNGRGDFFSERFERIKAAEEAGDETVCFAHMPSWEMNPSIPQSVFDEERADLGEEMFDSEYGARFLASGSALLSEEDIRSCIRPGGDLAPLELTDCVVGADFGYRRDPSAAVVVGRMRHSGELTVAAAREWGPAKDLSAGTWSHQQMLYREVAGLARAYGASIYCDTYEAATTRAQLGKFGAYVHLISMATEKFQVHQELARHIRSALITFPDHPALVSDLRRLKVNYGGQRPRIENPRGGGRHGDVGQALAVTMAAFAGEDAGGPAFGAVAHPGKGWSNAAELIGNDPVPGTEAFYALPVSEQYAICQRRSGLAGGGGAFFIPGNAGADYSNPGGSWLDAPANFNYD